MWGSDPGLYGQETIHISDIESRLDEIEGEVDDLRKLRDSGCETFIKENALTAEWAEEYALEIGAIKSDLSWPYTHIDWDAAADELKQDFSQYEFGDEYYYGK